jgi:acetoin utilization deacetylase AcuC-like enzyme
VVHAALEARSDLVVFATAAPAERTALALVHTPAYIDDILAPIPEGCDKAFDHETFAMTATPAATLAAAGQALRMAEALMKGETRRALVLASPGGHHAEADCALGFCFANHIGLAARWAEEMGAKRIAVFDFDAHHGNGTQSLFWNYENRLYVSVHEDNPLSGFARETGAWGNILNLPLAPHSDGAAFLDICERVAFPKIAAFKPDILLISAGFDMHTDDPLANMDLTTQDYATLGRRLATLADTHAEGRLGAVLEGGYNPAVLGASVAAFVEGISIG